MALSAANISASSYYHLPESCSIWFHGKENKLLMTILKRNCRSSWIVHSVLGNRQSSINDNGAAEPARVLLERLFAQTQKLEKMGGNSCLPMDAAELGFSLGTLETDLQAALSALEKKEVDLQDAERMIYLEQNKINSAKEELVRREQEIAAACSKKEILEEELKLANHNVASQASEIEDLKLTIDEREKEISDAHSKLALKEEEIKKMERELMTRNELAVATESELKTKARLLNEATEVVKGQDTEIQQLRNRIQQKENDLVASVKLRELEEKKLKVSESNLAKKTADWFIAQDELKKLAAEASKRAGEASAIKKEFQRVKKLLTDVRSELVSSQKALACSRQKMEDQEELLQKQLTLLEEEKRSVVSHTRNLKEAQAEMERERMKLRVSEARNKELVQDLSKGRELILLLQTELNREKSSLEKEIREKSFLQEKLEQESVKVGETQSLLQAKESELVEARLEIQRLKSEHDSLKHILEERDMELTNARRDVDDVNKEIIELKTLMTNRDDQLTQTETMLKDKEKHFEAIQLELDDTKMRSSEAESVIERIVELTNKLKISAGDDNYQGSSPLSKNLAGESKWEKKHLETEIEITRESLRTKEMEVLTAERALVMKQEELRRVGERLDEREEELTKMKEKMTQDANDLRQLYSLANERVEERSMGDLAIEKLQIEATQLEAEVATSALYKLTQMSRELLGKATSSLEAEFSMEFLLDSTEPKTYEVDGKCLGEFEAEVSRLSTLTEDLLKEAGIINGDIV